MTVNYTTNLALGQPVTGTESSSWGDDVNNAVTSYLDIAVAGGLSIAITTADVTLTNTQGTSSATNIGSTTAQYAILNISGAKTAARNLNLPITSKWYMINNAGTGGFALTVRGTTPTTGVTLTDGERVLVAWNGTDYVKVSTNTQTVATTNFPTTSSSAIVSATPAGASTAPLLTGTGSATATVYGHFINPQVNVTDSGGSAVTTVIGAQITPAILSSGDTTVLNITGLGVNLTRVNSNDLSSFSSTVYGINNVINYQSSLPYGVYTTTINGTVSDMRIQGGGGNIIQNIYALQSIFTQSATSPTASLTTVYGIRNSSSIGNTTGTAFTVTNHYGIFSSTSTGVSATITNFYGLYLAHTVTGTNTNRYGVYQTDASATNYFAGSVLASGATGGLGYGTGSGGTVTQGTSRTTGVTLSKNNGAITMFSAAGSAIAATFTVTNTLVAATDTIILNQQSGTNLYVLLVTAVAAGSFNITFYTTGGVATDAPVINFALIKAVTA